MSNTIVYQKNKADKDPGALTMELYNTKGENLMNTNKNNTLLVKIQNQTKEKINIEKGFFVDVLFPQGVIDLASWKKAAVDKVKKATVKYWQVFDGREIFQGEEGFEEGEWVGKPEQAEEDTRGMDESEYTTEYEEVIEDYEEYETIDIQEQVAPEYFNEILDSILEDVQKINDVVREQLRAIIDKNAEDNNLIPFADEILGTGEVHDLIVELNEEITIALEDMWDLKTSIEEDREYLQSEIQKEIEAKIREDLQSEMEAKLQEMEDVKQMTLEEMDYQLEVIPQIFKELLIETKVSEMLSRPTESSDQWDLEVVIVEEGEQKMTKDYIRIAFNSSQNARIQLHPHDFLTIQLNDITPLSSERRNTSVELQCEEKYKEQLKLFYGQANLEIVRGGKPLPVIPTVEKGKTILNDGNASNKIVLRLTNSSGEELQWKEGKVVVTFDALEEDDDFSTALMNKDKAEEVKVTLNGNSEQGFQKTATQGRRIRFELDKLNLTIPPRKNVEVHLDGVINSMPMGVSRVYVYVENLFGFRDEMFTFNIQRSPVTILEDKKAGESTSKDLKLKINGKSPFQLVKFKYKLEHSFQKYNTNWDYDTWLPVIAGWDTKGGTLTIGGKQLEFDIPFSGDMCMTRSADGKAVIATQNKDLIGLEIQVNVLFIRRGLVEEQNADGATKNML